MSLLHRASRGGRVTVAETLLQAGADANIPGHRGKTPLHEASRAGCASVVSLLVKHGANVNAEDRRARTPLHYTTSDEVRRVLIDAGANPDARDNMGEKPHLTVGTSESSSRRFGRISGPRRLLVDASDAHNSRNIPRSSEDNVDKLHDAHRDSRERDLETSVVRRLKESLKHSERLATWLENHLAKYRSDTSCLKEYSSRRRHDGRREYRRPSEPTTALDTSSLSHSPSSCRSSVSDHMCLRRPRRRNSGRESPARAKAARCGKNSSKRASDEPGARNKHVRNSRSKPSWANGGQANAKGTPQGFRPHFSDDKLGSLAAGDDKSWWCTHGKLSGSDPSDHDTDEDVYTGVSVVDRRHSSTAGRGVRYPENTSSRPRRRHPERRGRTRPQRNRSKRPVSIYEEAERVGAHSLVRSISTAMMEMTAGSDSPGSPGGRRGRAVDETVSTSTEQPTSRQEYRRGTPVVARRRRELGEEENEQVRLGTDRFNESYSPKSGTGRDGVGSSPHRGHVAKEKALRRRTTDEMQSSSDCLAYDLSDSRLDRGAASQRTPPRRGARRLHRRGEDQRGTTGDGLTKAERLVAVKLLNFVSETIGTAVPRSPWKCRRREGTARDPVVGRDAGNGQDVDLTTAAANRCRDDNLHQDSVGISGDDDVAGGEGKGCEKGSVGNEAGGFVGGDIDDQEDVTGSLSKPKEQATAVAVKQNAVPTTLSTFTAPLVSGSPGANLAALTQEEGPNRHFQENAVCADHGKSESAIIAAKRTVADQVLEVAEQLSRMCVMPVD